MAEFRKVDVRAKNHHNAVKMEVKLCVAQPSGFESSAGTEHKRNLLEINTAFCVNCLKL